MLKAEKSEVEKIDTMLIIFPSGHAPDFREYLTHGCISVYQLEDENAADLKFRTPGRTLSSLQEELSVYSGESGALQAFSWLRIFKKH